MLRGRQVFINGLLGDEPLAASPTVGRLAQEVVDLELVVLRRQVIKLLLETASA